MIDSFSKAKIGDLPHNTVFRDIHTNEYGVISSNKQISNQIVEIIIPHQENSPNRFYSLFSLLDNVSKKIELTMDSDAFILFDAKQILCEYDEHTHGYDIIEPILTDGNVEFFVLGNARFRP